MKLGSREHTDSSTRSQTSNKFEMSLKTSKETNSSRNKENIANKQKKSDIVFAAPKTIPLFVGKGAAEEDCLIPQLMKKIEMLSQLFSSQFKQYSFLQVDLIQDLLILVEDYCKDKVQIKLSALAQFLGCQVDQSNERFLRQVFFNYPLKLLHLGVKEKETYVSSTKTRLLKTIDVYSKLLSPYADESLILSSHSRIQTEDQLMSLLVTADFQKLLFQIYRLLIELNLSKADFSLGIQLKNQRTYTVSNCSKLPKIHKGQPSHCICVLNNPYSTNSATNPSISTSNPTTNSTNKIDNTTVAASSNTCTVDSICIHTVNTVYTVLPVTLDNSISLTDTCTSNIYFNANLDYVTLSTDVCYNVCKSSILKNITSNSSNRSKKSVKFIEIPQVYEFDKSDAYDKRDTPVFNNQKKIMVGDSWEEENKENSQRVANQSRLSKKSINLRELEINPNKYMSSKGTSSKVNKDKSEGLVRSDKALDKNHVEDRTHESDQRYVRLQQIGNQLNEVDYLFRTKMMRVKNEINDKPKEPTTSGTSKSSAIYQSREPVVSCRIEQPTRNRNHNQKHNSSRSQIENSFTFDGDKKDKFLAVRPGSSLNQRSNSAQSFSRHKHGCLSQEAIHTHRNEQKRNKSLTNIRRKDADKDSNFFTQPSVSSMYDSKAFSDNQELSSHFYHPSARSFCPVNSLCNKKLISSKLNFLHPASDSYAPTGYYKQQEKDRLLCEMSHIRQRLSEAYFKSKKSKC